MKKKIFKEPVKIVTFQGAEVSVLQNLELYKAEIGYK
jgi:hypothetical protein